MTDESLEYENVKKLCELIDKALQEFCKGYIFDSLKDENVYDGK